LVQQAPKVHKESKAFKGFKVIKAYKDQLELRDQPVALQVHKDLKVNRDQREPWVHRGWLVQPDRWACRVFLGNKDLWGHKDRRVCRAQLAPLGRKAFPVPPEPQV
jgi:hypothetical protein